MTTENSYTALVLGGRRGPDDPFARSRGASHRALLEVAGVPMLVRVLTALRAARRVSRLIVSIDAPEVLETVPALANARDLSLHRSTESPARSVADALASIEDERVLVTTADHALLSGARIDRFLDAADATGADVAVGVVERSAFGDDEARSQRTWIKLRCGWYTGANLFALRHANARSAALFFARAERHRKRPWRLAAALGPTLALEYLAGTLDLNSACRQISRSAGATIRPVLLEEAAAAIDVDKLADLELAEKILAAGGGS